jgi:hypothetical protein
MAICEQRSWSSAGPGSWLDVVPLWFRTQRQMKAQSRASVDGTCSPITPTASKVDASPFRSPEGEIELNDASLTTNKPLAPDFYKSLAQA